MFELGMPVCSTARFAITQFANTGSQAARAALRPPTPEAVWFQLVGCDVLSLPIGDGSLFVGDPQTITAPLTVTALFERLPSGLGSQTARLSALPAALEKRAIFTDPCAKAETVTPLLRHCRFEHAGLGSNMYLWPSNTIWLCA